MKAMKAGNSMTLTPETVREILQDWLLRTTVGGPPTVGSVVFRDGKCIVYFTNGESVK